jgi:hypothetical protein
MKHLEKSYTKIIIICLGAALISSALLLVFYNFYQACSKILSNELLKVSSNISLIIQPGYEIEINKKPIVVFGEDDCTNKEANPLFTIEENPTNQCIKITKDTTEVMVHLIVNRQIVTEQWKVLRSISPKGNLTISLKRPNGEAVIPFNRIEKIIGGKV